ncbi:MAG: hypothetical protein KIT22_14475 [Verrucomicrobiae bacterium]|nr:hypothetical protein [Verrucomicrobiae bacterium]
MSTVQEVESAIARLSPAEVREVAEWLETFLESQLEVRPEFVERLELAQRQLAQGESRVVNP